MAPLEVSIFFSSPAFLLLANCQLLIAIDQVFGVDLEARARADRKRVPVIVTNILTFLDNRMDSSGFSNQVVYLLTFGADYPDLEGDEARRAIWLHDVPLAATHHLRQALNTSVGDPRAILEKYEIPIVASVLKLYLLELPGKSPSQYIPGESRLINIF